MNRSNVFFAALRDFLAFLRGQIKPATRKIAEKGHTYLASPIFSPMPTQLVDDGEYYMICVIRDVFDEEKKIKVSNIVHFSSQKNWIYSPSQSNRSDIPSEVITKIDETIEMIRKEEPIDGD